MDWGPFRLSHLAITVLVWTASWIGADCTTLIASVLIRTH